MAVDLQAASKGRLSRQQTEKERSALLYRLSETGGGMIWERKY